MITSIMPIIALAALVVVLVAAIWLAKKLLPDEYRWEVIFHDLLVDNLGDGK